MTYLYHQAQLCKQNKVDDTLSQCVTLLSTMHCEIITFDKLKDLYVDDVDFHDAKQDCISHHIANGMHIQDGFLFHENRLYILQSSLHDKLTRDIHMSGLSGAFRGATRLWKHEKPASTDHSHDIDIYCKCCPVYQFI